MFNVLFLAENFKSNDLNLTCTYSRIVACIIYYVVSRNLYTLCILLTYEMSRLPTIYFVLI